MSSQTKESVAHRGWVNNILSSAQDRKFYGTITIHVANGTITRAEKLESLKPPGKGG